LHGFQPGTRDRAKQFERIGIRDEAIPSRGVADAPRSGQRDPGCRAGSYRRPLSKNCLGSNPDAVLPADSAPISEALSEYPGLPVIPKRGHVEVASREKLGLRVASSTKP